MDKEEKTDRIHEEWKAESGGRKKGQEGECRKREEEGGRKKMKPEGRKEGGLE